MNEIILDTGALVALMDEADRWHQEILNFFQNNQSPLVMPTVIIPETCYLLNTHLGAHVEEAFILKCISGEIRLENLIKSDFVRGLELMRLLSKANIGFVDAAVASIAERLKIKQIITTDRRHFSLFRPKRCHSFALLP